MTGSVESDRHSPIIDRLSQGVKRRTSKLAEVCVSIALPVGIKGRIASIARPKKSLKPKPVVV